MGHWETNPIFMQNQSIYLLSMTGTQVTTAQYADIFNTFKVQMQELSGKSALRDAAWNAMAWSTFSFDDAETSMTFYSGTSPAKLLDNKFGNAIITTATDGACHWPYQYGSFDSGRHSLVFNIGEKNGPKIDPYKVKLVTLDLHTFIGTFIGPYKLI
jgi:hypothetical protein